MFIYILFLLLQCALFVVFFKYVRSKKSFFFQAFYFFFTLLLIIPFFLIFADCQGLLSLTSISAKAFHGTYSLTRGSGIRPVSVMVLFQIFFFLGGYFAATSTTSVPKKEIICQEPLNEYFAFASIVALIAIGYMSLRAYFVSDFPLLSLLTSSEHIPLRDLAFNYGSKTTQVPYIFRPSITSLFYRTLLPLSGMMFFVLGRKGYRPKLTYACSGVLLIVSFILLAGTMKRTPVLFFITWCFMALLLSQSTRIKRDFVVSIAVIILFLCVSTTAYNISLHQLFGSLFRRIFIVEGLKEFLCLEHYGTTFNYLGLEIPSRYFHKIMGEDVLTFSQVWKKQLGGVRGWSSIGVMAEFFASLGGLWAALAYACFGFILMKIDVICSNYFNNIFYLPFLSCLITIVAFTSTKGILSQMFTGGGGLLILLTLSLIFLCAFIRKRENLTTKEFEVS